MPARARVVRGLFYHYSPAGDIGHGVHLFRLAAALAAGGAELALLRDAGASYPPASAWKYGPVLTLPPKDPRNTPARSRKILAALKGFAPDFLLTAFFPLGRTGCAGEIEPALQLARESGLRIYSTVPMPYFSHSEADLPELFRFAGFYDRIFIHSPLVFDLRYMAAAMPYEKRVSPAAFEKVFLGLKDKLNFTGYVLPSGRPRRPAGRSGKYILVHRFCGPTSRAIVDCAIRAKGLLKSALPLVIVTGPSSTPAEMRRWRRMLRAAGPGITLVRETPDFFKLLAGCAVSVGTAGGTVYEALYLNRRSVLIPFKGAPGSERSDQIARAAMLKDLAGAAVLDYDELTPALLAEAIDGALADGSPGFVPPVEIFSGSEVFAAAVRRDLGRLKAGGAGLSA